MKSLVSVPQANDSNESAETDKTDHLALLHENARLKSQLRRLRQHMAELERRADADPLLSVYNRRAFMRELGRAQSVLDRYKIPACVIYIDLNNFKGINDQYGHAVGDEMLRKVGGVLQTNTRECDMVARLGGDEFGVLLFKTEMDTAQAKANVLAGHIDEVAISMPTGDVKTSASWGVAACSLDATAEEILSRADLGMYSSKRVGQNFQAG
jgi:diguanylate cyclase (GGDEF)-like protein